MAIDEKFTTRIREALADVRRVEEKRMFGGIAFMVNGKMCVTVRNDRMMCRIDPGLHQEALLRPGVRTVKMKGRAYTGFVYVKEDVVRTKKQLDYWVSLALDFNKRAKASR